MNNNIFEYIENKKERKKIKERKRTKKKKGKQVE